MSDEAFNTKYNARQGFPLPQQAQIHINNVMGNQCSGSSYMDDLERLHVLKEKGIISVQEFESKKAELIK